MVVNQERHWLCHGFESLLDPSEIENGLEWGDEDSEAQEEKPLSKVTELVSVK